MRFPTCLVVIYLAFVVSSAYGQLDFLTPFKFEQKFEPGQVCRASGRDGICKEFKFCSSEARKHATYTCGFNLRSFYICCPEKKTGALNSSPTVPAPRVNFQCGVRGTIPIRFGFREKRANFLPGKEEKFFKPGNIHHVVGGIEAVANSWPWMILLGRKQGPRNQYFCSAVLINKRYALTAAHCVLNPSPFFARLGEHDHSTLGRTTSSQPEDIKIEDVIIHPKYELNQGYNDIAILKLSRAVSVRNEIRPVCLPWGNLANERLVGQTVTITGWGSEQFGRAGSPVLREVQVKVFEPSVCQRSYSTISEFSRVFPRGMNEDNIVCAGNTLGGKDSCQGDSGGPIVHQGRGGSYYLAGIISKGYGCGKKDFPGLYAPIRNYENLNWIKRVAF